MVINPGPSGMNYLQMPSGSYPNGGMINPAAPTNLTNLQPQSFGNVQSLCCLIDNGQRCHRPSGNASYSKRIEKQVLQRKLRLEVDQRSPHMYICEHHKSIIQTVRNSGKRKRAKDEDPAHDDDQMNDYHAQNSAGHHSYHGHPQVGGFGAGSSMKSHHSSAASSALDVDLHSLQVNTLRRYKRHYRIPTKPGLNKNQLAEEISRHFRNIPVSEQDVINSFMFSVKYNCNKLDNPSKND